MCLRRIRWPTIAPTDSVFWVFFRIWSFRSELRSCIWRRRTFSTFSSDRVCSKHCWCFMKCFGNGSWTPFPDESPRSEKNAVSFLSVLWADRAKHYLRCRLHYWKLHSSFSVLSVVLRMSDGIIPIKRAHLERFAQKPHRLLRAAIVLNFSLRCPCTKISSKLSFVESSRIDRRVKNSHLFLNRYTTKPGNFSFQLDVYIPPFWPESRKLRAPWKNYRKSRWLLEEPTSTSVSPREGMSRLS